MRYARENQDKSIADWKKALDILDTTDISITVITPDYMETTVKILLKGIQAGLGSYLTDSNGDAVNLTLKVETMDEADIRNAISTNTYDIAFLPFRATSNNASAFLSSVIGDRNVEFNSDKATSLINKAQAQGTLSATANILNQAEKTILASYTICPVVYEESFYASAKGVKGIQFHPGTGRVSFVNATRE